MTEKEISEIRRRFTAEKSNITRVCGCYVNEKREIISRFDESLALMFQNESDELLSILKKTLSGSIDKNLLDIRFSNKQIIEGEEYALLTGLRKSELADDALLTGFYDKIIKSISFEGNFLILVACDKYDIFHYSSDGAKKEDSSDIFTYIICAVCPIKATKPGLSYYAGENKFHSIPQGTVIAPPELGFMFPAFDNRQANICNALYYTRSLTDNHSELAFALLGTELPMPAAAQKEAFGSVLSDTVSEECNLGVVQAVHDKVVSLMTEHKENKVREPLCISKAEMTDILTECGVSKEHVEDFEEKYDEEFGSEAELSAKNIIDTKRFELKNNDITIKVNPERSDLVETRVIDGMKYIMIRVDNELEVNGVNIHII